MERIIRHLKSNAPDAQPSREILIVCEDPLLSLDLEMCLQSQGFSTHVTRYCSIPAFAPDGQSGFAGVILDIHARNVITPVWFNWLTAAAVPVIAISTFERESIERLPEGTVLYSKPLSVDDMDASAFTTTAARRAGVV
jgi:hypothetical protein